MEKYIYILAEGALETWQGDLPESDIQDANDGHIIIIRLSDLKTLFQDSDWVDIEFLPFKNQ